jgi:hypothetical protein
MFKKMIIAALGLVLGLAPIAGAWAQQGAIEATTSTGERVRLLPDGRWEYMDGQKAAVQRTERAVEAKKQEEVKQVELKRERSAQGGGQLGLGRTLYEGDKDYNRGSMNPKLK